MRTISRLRGLLFPLGASKLEQELVDLYRNLLQRVCVMSRREARKSAKIGVIQCREDAVKDGTLGWSKMGTTIIQAAADDVKPFSEWIRWARREGATDEDICWWWDMHDLERRTMVWAEDVMRAAVFLEARGNGESDEQAARDVRRIFPMYGHNPRATVVLSEQDRRLPHELRDRVNRYCERDGHASVAQQASESSSFNAFIRQMIQKGRL